MTHQKIDLDARLGLNRYEIDLEQNHIQVDQKICLDCPQKPCLTACPAQVYLWGNLRLTVHYENCLECGTCQIACDEAGNHGLSWRNPTNGFGIQFRWG